ncbi:MAG: alpha-glucan family phosphorylase [Bacillota bacterium]|jgi:starch phosphorylase
MTTLIHSLPRVAYFCMEYGLAPEFRIYSGGLGILAGDHIKTAGELGLPMVAIGLLWQHGYTQQLIGDDGRPFDVFLNSKYDFLIDTGVTVNVTARGQNVVCKVWKTEHFGNAPLYLLDTAVPENKEPLITDRLYSGSTEDRLAQEIVLGIGGVRALRALGIEVDVYHFNEGHAALAGVELIREQMAQGASFEEAWRRVRAQIVFTTHTPVPAGNASYSHAALCYTGAYNGLSYDQMMRIGGDPFNMTVAGLRLARLANAVAELHGQTARNMWQNVSGTCPIISITNGVHPGTWQDPNIWDAYQSGTGLWQPHQEAKQNLIDYIAVRTGTRFAMDAIIVGFARRAASYKRSNLIFGDPAVINPMLHSGKLQLVFAGKAHPQDGHGKEIVASLVAKAREFPNSVVFLENYDMRIGKLLTRGCDVWLNNPRRPQEACGTSGMKASMNGVLNLSILDGWWPEGCRHGVNGWQIGEACEGPDQDEKDRRALYHTLFNEVMPVYYNDRNRWEHMMRASIEMAVTRFSTHRMLREYYQLLYGTAETEAVVESAS